MEFMEEWNPAVQHTLLSRKADKGMVALAESVPTLALLAYAFPTEGGEDSVAALWVKVQLSDYFDFVEAPLGVTDERVYEIGLLIAERYWYLNVAEVELWIAEMKAHGVEWYGAAGPSRLMGLLREYVRERNAAIGRIEAERAEKRIRGQMENAEAYRGYYREYLRGLKARADDGDEEARKDLENNKSWREVIGCDDAVKGGSLEGVGMECPAGLTEKAKGVMK